MPFLNHYQMLGLTPDATAEEVRRAYRVLALKWHPDRHPNDVENATNRFLEVQEAYRAINREHFQFLDSSLSLPISSPTISDSSYPSGHTFSVSSSSLGSFIHISASSADSLTIPSSPAKGGPPPFLPHHLRSFSYPLNARERQIFQCANEDPLYRTSTGEIHARPPLRHSFDDLHHPVHLHAGYLPTVYHNYDAIRYGSSQAHNTEGVAFSRDYYDIQRCHQTMPLSALGLGPSGEWIYRLSLGLEELAIGKRCRFSFERRLTSGVSTSVILEVNIPPGCGNGTRILCRGVGHEHRDGTRQDIAFIVEELSHQYFTRVHDDLILIVRIPWNETIRHRGSDIKVEGIDSREYSFHVDYPRNRSLKGKHVIRGAGMPVRQDGRVIRKGNLIVQWEIVLQHQHPKLSNFMRRFMGFRK